MRALLILLTVLSVAINVAWWARRHSAEPREPARESIKARFEVDHRAADLLVGVREIAKQDSSDLATLRDRLRAAGVDEASIRAVLEGELRRKYREELSVRRIEQLSSAWWRPRMPAEGGFSTRERVDEPLRALLGPDPLDLADAESRYDFLPSEKRRLLAAIDLDYAALLARGPQARGNARLKSEIDEQQMLNREKQKDLIAALTPDERAEYELRFSQTASLVSSRLAAIDGTEQEFRAIKPIIDQFSNRRAEPSTTTQPTAHVDPEQEAMDQLVATIGYERALTYIWAEETKRFEALRQLDLPEDTGPRWFQLAAETGARASAIHADSSLTVEQKREALLALKNSIRPQVDALISPSLQSKLPEEAKSWFSQLQDGRYQPIQPLVLTTGLVRWPAASVTVPLKDPLLTLPRPRSRENHTSGQNP